MDTHVALRRAGRIPYTLLRAPLGIVDERVVAKFLGQDSAARQSYERALDRLDNAAAKWLSEPQDAPLITPPESDQRNEPQWDEAGQQDEADPEPQAAEEPVTEPTAEAVPETAETAGAQAEEDEREEIEELADELLVQEETETFAGELAEDDELRRVQAELTAKRLVAEQHEGQV